MITLYTRSNCTRCDSVKEALNNRKIIYEEFIIGKDIPREDVLEKFPGATILPLVTIDGTWVGGRDEILLMLGRGELT